MVKLGHILADDLTRHASLRGIDQCLPSEDVHLDAKLLLHEAARFSARKTITGYNRCGMYLGLNKFVGAAKEFSSDDDNGSGSIPDLLVLFLGKVDKDSSSGMFNGQQR